MLNSGIYNEILSLINNQELQPSTNLVVSTCSAYDYLNNSVPNLEKMTVKYYETFSITSRFTGYISNISIGQFYDFLATEGASSIAILGGLNSTTRQEVSKESESQSASQGSSSGGSGGGSSVEGSGGSSGGGSGGGGSSGGSSSGGSSGGGSGSTNSQQSSNGSADGTINPEDLTAGTSTVTGDRGSENIGIAVFKDDKYCGELTAVETICHLLLVNDVDSCVISVDSPLSNDTKMEMRLMPSKKSKVEVNIENEIPHIKINLKVDADIMTLENNVNYQSNETLNKVSNSTKEYLENQINEYLNKVCKQYGVDIDNFYSKALGYFATIPEWENFNWNEKIKNAEFDVNVDVNVISSILLTQT